MKKPAKFLLCTKSHTTLLPIFPQRLACFSLFTSQLLSLSLSSHYNILSVSPNHSPNWKQHFAYGNEPITLSNRTGNLSTGLFCFSQFALFSCSLSISFESSVHWESRQSLLSLVFFLKKDPNFSSGFSILETMRVSVRTYVVEIRFRIWKKKNKWKQRVLNVLSSSSSSISFWIVSQVGLVGPLA